MRRSLYLVLLTIFSLLMFGRQDTAVAIPQQAAIDWRFGVVEAYENPGAASALGVGWSRVTFHWAFTQQGGPGTWTPTVSDAQINNEV
ncbi:MAG: hypothetical protein AAF490_28740, partial [Chloroflexota bacterium]